MNTLENIGNLVERVVGKIERAADERESLFTENSSLRERLVLRDKEAVKVARDMRAELEAARADALRLEQERARVNGIFERLNDRLLNLAAIAAPDSTDVPENETHFGG